MVYSTCWVCLWKQNWKRITGRLTRLETIRSGPDALANIHTMWCQYAKMTSNLGIFGTNKLHLEHWHIFLKHTWKTTKSLEIVGLKRLCLAEGLTEDHFWERVISESWGRFLGSNMVYSTSWVHLWKQNWERIKRRQTRLENICPGALANIHTTWCNYNDLNLGILVLLTWKTINVNNQW